MDLRPRPKSIWRGKSKSAVSIFSVVICKVILKKQVKMDYTKIDTTDLDSPRQELFVRSLGFVIALTVFSGIVFCLRLQGEQSRCTRFVLDS